MGTGIRLSAVGLVLCLCGCGALEEAWDTTPEPPSVQAPELTLPVTGQASGPSGSDVQPVSSAPRSGVHSASPATGTAPAVATSSRTDLVTLSAGTALPQSLPTGTTMSFSVDYTLRERPAGSSVQYFWVIERTTGSPVSIPVQLKARGNLVRLLPGWRPEHGPFRAYISARTSSGQVKQISRPVPLS